jgi:hypothetical protein
MFILVIGFCFGAAIILAFPILLIVVSKAKKQAEIVRKRADEIIQCGKGSSSDINEIIDLLISIEKRRNIPFTEEDRVRVDKLRKLRS